MSYASFASTLTGITVTGVKRAYTAPPAQISTADLPALFPRLPQGNTAIDTLGRTSGLLSMTCDVVLIVEPVMQNRATANYTASLALMDALDTALRTVGRYIPLLAQPEQTGMCIVPSLRTPIQTASKSWSAFASSSRCWRPRPRRCCSAHPSRWKCRRVGSLMAAVGLILRMPHRHNEKARRLCRADDFLFFPWASAPWASPSP